MTAAGRLASRALAAALVLTFALPPLALVLTLGWSDFREALDRGLGAALAAFGRAGLLGGALASAGLSLPFTTAAVVLAQIFVAAPFYVLPLAESFRAIDEDVLWTARSLRASPSKVFLRLAVPMAAPALLGGVAVAWARALGEFGATLVFAGNLPGATQTLPIAIYVAMEGDLGPARAMALVLLVVAGVLFVALRSSWLQRAIGRSAS